MAHKHWIQYGGAIHHVMNRGDRREPIFRDDQDRIADGPGSVLRELALKFEGLRIAVRRGDLKKLAKRLEQFGYLSSIG